MKIKAIVCISLLFILGTVGRLVQADVDSIWLTDDVTKRVYQVSVEAGKLLSSFNNPRPRDYSEIAVDPMDGTLWITSESGSLPGVVFNADREGTVLSQFEFGQTPEGVVVDPIDNTLWIPEDLELAIYSVSKKGGVINGFSTSDYDPGSVSPQAISYDPYSDTLWITDNSANKVYNVEKSGSLISSFIASDIDPDFTGSYFNVQGISFDERSRTLWITSRATGKYYNVTITGDLIKSFSSAAFDSTALNLTGIAYDGVLVPELDLSALQHYSVLALPGAKLKIKDGNMGTGMVGDVVLGPHAKQEFTDGLLTGTLLVDPGADNSRPNNVVISGGTVDYKLAYIIDETASLANTATTLPVDQVFDKIDHDATIVGVSGINVVHTTKIDLDNETLRLSGNRSSAFVFLLDEKILLRNGSKIVLDGDVHVENVYFHVMGNGDSSIESGSFATGTIHTPHSKINIKGQGSLLVGAIFGGDEIKLEDGGRLRVPGAMLPYGSLGEANSATLMGLPGATLKISDANSTVIGDVYLGPLAKQNFSDGQIEGDFLFDPQGDNDNSHGVVITGATIEKPLSFAAADALDSSRIAAQAIPDQSFGDIKTTQSIIGKPGINVITANKIELDKGKSLTLVGDRSTIFVINLLDKLKLKEASSINLVGGIRPENVLYNVLGDKESALESGAAVQGTILAPKADRVKIKDSGTVLNGKVIIGKELILEKGAVIRNAL